MQFKNWDFFLISEKLNFIFLLSIIRRFTVIYDTC